MSWRRPQLIFAVYRSAGGVGRRSNLCAERIASDLCFLIYSAGSLLAGMNLSGMPGELYMRSLRGNGLPSRSARNDWSADDIGDSRGVGSLRVSTLGCKCNAGRTPSGPSVKAVQLRLE